MAHSRRVWALVLSYIGEEQGVSGGKVTGGEVWQQMGGTLQAGKEGINIRLPGNGFLGIRNCSDVLQQCAGSEQNPSVALQKWRGDAGWGYVTWQQNDASPFPLHQVAFRMLQNVPGSATYLDLLWGERDQRNSG